MNNRTPKRGGVMVLREVGVKYTTTEKTTKDERQTMRVREDVYDYIVKQADLAFRTPPAQMEHFKELHKMVKEFFGTDDLVFVRSEIERLRKKAGEGK